MASFKKDIGKKKRGKTADVFDSIDWDKLSEYLTLTDDEAKAQIEALTITGTGNTPEKLMPRLLKTMKKL